MPWQAVQHWKSAAGVSAAIVVCAVAIGVSAQTKAPASPKTGPVTPPATDADKIRSALSAAPAAIAKDATVMDMPSMKVLRKGTNGWTCFPDGPSPGVDPMCTDKNGMEWADAWTHHKDPPKDKMAIGYMINGHVISVSVDDNPEFRAAQGILSLQLEGSGQVWYRNVYVKPLDR